MLQQEQAKPVARFLSKWLSTCSSCALTCRPGTLVFHMQVWHIEVESLFHSAIGEDDILIQQLSDERPQRLKPLGCHVEDDGANVRSIGLCA